MAHWNQHKPMSRAFLAYSWTHHPAYDVKPLPNLTWPCFPGNWQHPSVEKLLHIWQLPWKEQIRAHLWLSLWSRLRMVVNISKNSRKSLFLGHLSLWGRWGGVECHLLMFISSIFFEVDCWTFQFIIAQWRLNSTNTSLNARTMRITEQRGITLWSWVLLT